MIAHTGLPFFLSLSLLSVAGCGVSVPRLQDIVETRETGVIIDGIVYQTNCEIQSAVQMLVLEDVDLSNSVAGPDRHPQGRKVAWLDNYLANITLTLTIDEKSSINPGLTTTALIESEGSVFKNKLAISTAQSFSLGLGANLSSDATRKDTLSWLLDFSRFTTPAALAIARAARDSIRHSRADNSIPVDMIVGCDKKSGSSIEGDLQVRDWLRGVALPAYPSYTSSDKAVNDYGKALQDESKAIKKDVLGHDITFVLLYGGNVTPTWKLLRVSANQGSTPFIMGQRTRTQDLQITMGPPQEPQKAPADTSAKPPVPSQELLNTVLAGQIGLAVANAIRNNQ